VSYGLVGGAVVLLAAFTIGARYWLRRKGF
jgi:hypothetical protein